LHLFGFADDDIFYLATTFQGVKASPLQERTLNQAVRSLLLAQASDWPFIMTTGTTVEYATKRITDHLARFN
jgi:1,4-alpha-glucan branching enzyme